MALLDLSLFENQQADKDVLPQNCLVIPAILPDLLDPCSTLIAAPAGYGKTTLASLARSSATTWMHVRLGNDDLVAEEVVDSLLAAMTKWLWRFLGERPAAFQLLSRRAEAVKYFMREYVGLDIDYWLEMLAEDHPDQAEHLQALARLQPRRLFTETADDELRLSILLDCIRKLEFTGVGVWLDLHGELDEFPNEVQDFLAYLYDFLNLMRNRNLYIKCLAPPSVIRFLETRRGASTLSVTTLALVWSQDQLVDLINRRLDVASRGRIHHLDSLIDPGDFLTFLRDYSDPHSPLAWISLTRHLGGQINQSGQTPATGSAWLSARRAYCAAHLKIRRDQEGRFWRGDRLLDGLTPRKRVIYPLIDYLYEHPGIHRPYQLTGQLKIDESSLNTSISRARKEHIEPHFGEEEEEENGFIYLVTDFQSGGYKLQNTDRSP